MFKIKLRFIPRSSRKNFSIFFWQHSDAYNMAAHKDNHWMGIRNGMTVFASSKVNELKLSSGREFEGTSQILTQRRYCCTSFTYSILWCLSTFTLVKEEKKKLVVEFFAFRNSPRLLEIAKRIMGVVFSPPFNRVFKQNYSALR